MDTNKLQKNIICTMIRYKYKVKYHQTQIVGISISKFLFLFLNVSYIDNPT